MTANTVELCFLVPMENTLHGLTAQSEYHINYRVSDKPIHNVSNTLKLNLLLHNFHTIRQVIKICLRHNLGPGGILSLAVLCFSDRKMSSKTFFLLDLIIYLIFLSRFTYNPVVFCFSYAHFTLFVASSGALK